MNINNNHTKTMMMILTIILHNTTKQINISNKHYHWYTTIIVSRVP